MKFVDEATISVQAGNGGHGCLSFRREKFVERGGPDGGDGGDGGNVFLVANVGVNTLADFRVARNFKAGNGQSGAGRNKTGKSGDDLDVIVPCGTVVNDVDTGELIGDLTEPGQRLMIAEAGRGGLGNTRFKSSTNRAPRKITQGSPGEKRHLMLELKPGYPFTTLHPNLGVVAVGPLQSFVMADVPGLIEGAAEGAGLGIQFLKHLQRTKLLLHLVDIAPIEPGADPANDFRAIEKELVRFSEDVSEKPRWLVLNKTDLLKKEDMASVHEDLVDQLSWDGPVFETSAVSGEGTEELAQAVMRELENMAEQAQK
jgi:GTP-binding protein